MRGEIATISKNTYMRRPRCNFQTSPSPLLSSSNPLLLGCPPAGQVSSPGHNCEAFNAYITLYIYDAMNVSTTMMVINLAVKVSGEVSPQSPPRGHCSCQEATLLNRDGT